MHPFLCKINNVSSILIIETMGSAKNKDSTTAVTNLFSATSQYRVDYNPVVASNSKKDTLIETDNQVIDPSVQKSEKKVVKKDKTSSVTSKEANGVETQRSKKKIGLSDKIEPTQIDKKEKVESKKRA
jgi:hypothetical protein